MLNVNYSTTTIYLVNPLPQFVPALRLGTVYSGRAHENSAAMVLYAATCGTTLSPYTPGSSFAPCHARWQGACHAARLSPGGMVTHIRQQALGTGRKRPTRLFTRPYAVTMDDGCEYESTATSTRGSSSSKLIQQLIYERAVKGVEGIRRQHPHEGVSSQGGRVFEVHVEASFNLNAVRNNSPYRCGSCRDTLRNRATFCRTRLQV